VALRSPDPVALKLLSNSYTLPHAFIPLITFPETTMHNFVQQNVQSPWSLHCIFEVTAVKPVLLLQKEVKIA